MMRKISAVTATSTPAIENSEDAGTSSASAAIETPAAVENSGDAGTTSACFADLKNSCVASHYNRREPFSIPKSLHPLYDATVPPASDDTQLAPQANARIHLTSVSEHAT